LQRPAPLPSRGAERSYPCRYPLGRQRPDRETGAAVGMLDAEGRTHDSAGSDLQIRRVDDLGIRGWVQCLDFGDHPFDKSICEAVLPHRADDSQNLHVWISLFYSIVKIVEQVCPVLDEERNGTNRLGRGRTGGFRDAEKCRILYRSEWTIS
jgi:hypothetical protein